MKKNIWIWNHYATNMIEDKAGRHYWLAENLIVNGYNPTIFCASTLHNTDGNIDTEGNIFTKEESGDVPFVIVKTPKYSGNGKKRIINMISFYKNLFPTAKKYANEHGKPDVILASSVHPLTLVAGIKMAKKLGVPCICEVRDLWPESIVAYGSLKKNSVVAKILYLGEKWIYRNADSVIMTWEGGKQYIIDQGWDNQIDLNKIQHISNGVIIDSFDKNSQYNKILDSDLEDKNYKNLVYAGSIRRVNNLGLLLDAAKIIQEYDKKVRFLIYGSGDEKEMLENRCKEEGISNVIFKGRVDKKMVPSILTRSYANILHNSSTSLDKYGQSQNKFFEYLAAGRLIIQTYTTGYSILEKYNCGVSAIKQQPKDIAEIILEACKDNEKAEQVGANARKAAYEFDFANLTKKLIEIIENV
ncbi:glycosyltransferase family 4 protein [Acidaminobacter hydrogenoformans]|uniref:Glycosyltransferase involved in cell wall bisynthesis n=1 Tax=Acidaminobacter hydrogenoformans DSM 2784 TaxID=1120920 RepID=A0A1G5S4U9_9FIRM|nr:glycosyltransferase family 4 protein [Acidaminobacter hydrogenoformans]SCZ81394.1 Glycosyltransferase involved in cell wall bisynthesis [Acidaminobacter hydrogenoformans DSM 2784]